MNLDVVTPAGMKLDDMQVDELVVPGVMGELGILPGHEAFATALSVGVMTIISGEKTVQYAISGGFVSVLEDDIDVLAETCERADEIDRQRALERLTELREQLTDLAPIDKDRYLSVIHSIKKAQTRLFLAESISNRY